LKPVVEPIAVATRESVADNIISIYGTPKIAVYSANIIDDTTDFAAYTTDAPTPFTGLLPFVSRAKPISTTRRVAMIADDDVLSSFGFYEVAA
jgi:hypothetical protein